MIVNFRARGINRGARKLTRTPTLIKKKNSFLSQFFFTTFSSLSSHIKQDLMSHVIKNVLTFFF
jgi:hypothetical protein